MGDLLPRLRRWWDSARPSWSGQCVPYAVACRCGHTLHGQRRRRHQIVRCPSCNQSVFILPYSAYPAVHGVHSGSPKENAGVRTSRRAWRVPILAALMTLILAVVGFFWVWPHLNRKQEPPTRAVSAAREKLDKYMKEGENALAEGSFPLALEKFTAAVKLRDHQPDLLNHAEHRKLNQLYWQSDLLAKQLDLSLVELLKQRLRHTDDNAWQARFDLHYRDKPMVFRGKRLDRAGIAELEGATVNWKEENHKVEFKVRVALDGLQFLEYLPPGSPQRVIFGARLKSFTGQDQDWVLRFQPNSDVLLTDRSALKALDTDLSNREIDNLLRSQEELSRKLRRDLPPLSDP